MTERPILMSDALVRGILSGKKRMTRRLVSPQPPDDDPIIAVERYCPVVVDRRGEEQAGPEVFGAYGNEWGRVCPFGGPGDRLYVREAWSKMGLGVYPCPRAWYRADFSEHDDPRARESTHERGCNGNWADCWACEKDRHGSFRWTPSIHMPRWASRLTLDVTGIRCERAQDISDADVAAEGIDWEFARNMYDAASPAARQQAGAPPARDWKPRDWFGTVWMLLYGVDSWRSNPWVWVIEFRRPP